MRDAPRTLTTNGLLVLVAILSLIRGVFLLFPRLPVPAYGVKAVLLAGVILAWRVYFGSGSPDLGSAVALAHPRRFLVVLVIAILGIVLLPNGEPATTDGPPTADDTTARPGSPPPNEPPPLAPPVCDDVVVLARSEGPRLPQQVAPAPPTLTDLAAPPAPPPLPVRRWAIFNVWSEAQKRALLEYADSLIIAGVTALLLIWFVVRSFYIPSESMVPTLEINDMILVDEMVYRLYRPARGDIVVFRPPERANSKGKDFIKRVVAVEGDTVRFENDITYVNGAPVDEPFRNRPKAGDDWPAPRDFEPVTVPPGHVFCMGDNRPYSEDSRVWGTVPVENIIGKAFVIFYPLQRMKMLH